MRKLLLSAALLIAANSAHSQLMVSSFDTLQLSGADTFYVNYSQPGQDVGFWDGISYFPSVFDTSSFGPFWSSGFSYSNMTDTTTPGYMNDKSAITGIGFNGSPNYAVFWQGYGISNIKFTPGLSWLRANGLYVTNATYAYLSMRDGDFAAKKFGGPTGTDPDWFLLSVYCYFNGNIVDSVEHYLADFRSSDSTLDYIQNDWQWIDLGLTPVDSIGFRLSSSDTGQFGMNTPAYFCLDNFTMQLVPDFVSSAQQKANIKIYPNPAHDILHIESAEKLEYRLFDATGKLVLQASDTKQINISSLVSGTYFLQLSGNNRQASVRFIKQ